VLEAKTTSLTVRTGQPRSLRTTSKPPKRSRRPIEIDMAELRRALDKTR